MITVICRQVNDEFILYFFKRKGFFEVVDALSGSGGFIMKDSPEILGILEQVGIYFVGQHIHGRAVLPCPVSPSHPRS